MLTDAVERRTRMERRQARLVKGMLDDADARELVMALTDEVLPRPG